MIFFIPNTVLTAAVVAQATEELICFVANARTNADEQVPGTYKMSLSKLAYECQKFYKENFQPQKQYKWLLDWWV